LLAQHKIEKVLSWLIINHSYKKILENALQGKISAKHLEEANKDMKEKKQGIFIRAA
jgi:hypothetical protein